MLRRHKQGRRSWTLAAVRRRIRIGRERRPVRGTCSGAGRSPLSLGRFLIPAFRATPTSCGGTKAPAGLADMAEAVQLLAPPHCLERCRLAGRAAVATKSCRSVRRLPSADVSNACRRGAQKQKQVPAKAFSVVDVRSSLARRARAAGVRDGCLKQVHNQKNPHVRLTVPISHPSPVSPGVPTCGAPSRPK